MAMLPMLLAAATWVSVLFAGGSMLAMMVAGYGPMADVSAVIWMVSSAAAVVLSGATLVAAVLGFTRVAASGRQVQGRRYAVLGALAGLGGGAAIVVPVGTVVLATGLLFAALVMSGGGMHGRPLRGVRVRLALPIGIRGPPRDVPAGIAWARSAVAEHESVEAFEALACDLEGLGASPELAARARAAAGEEADHALRCLALAQRHLGLVLVPLSFGAPRARATLAGVADEAVHDGVLGEGLAAAIAGEAAHQVADAQTEATLRVIARDEASHAALAADVLRWAQSQGARPVLRPRPMRFPERPAHGGVPRADQARLAARLVVGVRSSI